MIWWCANASVGALFSWLAMSTWARGRRKRRQPEPALWLKASLAVVGFIAWPLIMFIALAGIWAGLTSESRAGLGRLRR